MKKVLQSLIIADKPKMRERILQGVQTVSIREDEREYREGLCMLCCPDTNWCVAVDIQNVRYCKAKEVKPEEYTADEYNSIEEMLADLRVYYPSITEESRVTVIKWANVRGRLVDEYRKTH